MASNKQRKQQLSSRGGHFCGNAETLVDRRRCRLLNLTRGSRAATLTQVILRRVR